MTTLERSRLAPISKWDKWETKALLDDFRIKITPDYSQFANVGELENWRTKLIHEALERKVEDERALHRRI